MIRSPKKGKMLVKSYLDGLYNGYFEGMDVMRTGYSPVREKIDVPPVLERINFKGGNLNPLNYAKYVRRFMSAVDTVFFEGARNMRAYQWADMLATNDNVPVTSTYKKRAAEYMNNSDTQIAAFEAQAEQEYQDSVAAGTPVAEAKRDKRRRLFELIEESRQEEVRQESLYYGQKTTFNQPPDGLLGWAARLLGNAGREFPPFKLVVPFTNVVANVANAAIDYTPWGIARGYSDGSVASLISDKMKRKDWDTLSDNQKKVALSEMRIKGMMGTAMMTALYMLSQAWDDDDEPAVEITANGTGDYKKNYLLQETGWQPYSIKYKGTWYSYQSSPLLVALSFVGNIRDYEKYRKEKPTDEGMITKMAIAANNSKTVFFDMTFLKGLNTFLQAATSNKNGNILDNVASGASSTAKGFLVPNMYTQVAKDIQSIFDIPVKEVGSSKLGALLRDIPVARNMFYDKINVLGEPIIADTDKFVSSETEAPLFQLMIDHKAFISPPNIKKDMIPDDKGLPRLMTDEEFYEYAKIRGEIIRKNLEANFKTYSKMSDGDFQSRMTSIQRNATKQAKLKVSKTGGSEYKKVD